jgi:hypothetical protein
MDIATSHDTKTVNKLSLKFQKVDESHSSMSESEQSKSLEEERKVNRD